MCGCNAEGRQRWMSGSVINRLGEGEWALPARIGKCNGEGIEVWSEQG